MSEYEHTDRMDIKRRLETMLILSFLLDFEHVHSSLMKNCNTGCFEMTPDLPHMFSDVSPPPTILLLATSSPSLLY